MDERCARAVEEAFIRFHERGLIYRDNRLATGAPFSLVIFVLVLGV